MRQKLTVHRVSPALFSTVALAYHVQITAKLAPKRSSTAWHVKTINSSLAENAFVKERLIQLVGARLVNQLSTLVVLTGCVRIAQPTVLIAETQQLAPHARHQTRFCKMAPALSVLPTVPLVQVQPTVRPVFLQMFYSTEPVGLVQPTAHHAVVLPAALPV
jgi:hypothetical protein